MIRWGWFHSYRSQGRTRVNIQGTIEMKGSGKIISGSEIMVKEGAFLSIGHDFFIGENTSIYCWEKIIIGDYFCLGYHSQIFDSDFHYSIDTNTGEVRPRNKPVFIGNYNWIGNKATIKKGVKTPNHITVASSYSLLAGDYTKIVDEYSIIGGNPAKLLASGRSRLWNNEFTRIKEIDTWFQKNPNEKNFIYDINGREITDFTENR